MSPKRASKLTRFVLRYHKDLAAIVVCGRDERLNVSLRKIYLWKNKEKQRQGRTVHGPGGRWNRPPPSPRFTFFKVLYTRILLRFVPYLKKMILDNPHIIHVYIHVLAAIWNEFIFTPNRFYLRKICFCGLGNTLQTILKGFLLFLPINKDHKFCNWCSFELSKCKMELQTPNLLA